MSKILGHNGYWNKRINEIEPYSVKWFPMDSEDNYWRNGNKSYAVDSIEYCHNQYNFRQNHKGSLIFGSKPRLMILGCSVTYGIGLPYGELWFNQLQEHYDIYNFAWPATSIEFCLLTLCRFKNLIQPDLIIGLLPVLERCIYIRPDKHYWLINDGDDDDLKTSYLTMYSQDTYRHKLSAMYKNQIALFRGTTPMLLSSWDWYFYREWQDIFQLPFFENTGDLARDGSHYGKTSHELFGQSINNYLQENNFVCCDNK